MNPVYLDIHIHTSENPDKLNQEYDVQTLYQEIGKIAGENTPCLISLTDHNTLNPKAYLDAIKIKNSSIHLLLGVELHIKNYDTAPAYHCHMIFKEKITSENINSINTILDKLYPQKQVERISATIPTLDNIIRCFDEYEFILLPHGGQSHATFDQSIPRGVKFDTTMERSIYYNQFEGYTARSKDGLDTTIEYFKRLGINDFVNLVTCTDNYTPSRYPQAKDPKASAFIPTWMYAAPSFEGLRLSLSESSRLCYSDKKPEMWSETIKEIRLSEENLNIDVSFSPGLNVIIGGSSSGKTLLVDSIYRKISGDSFENSDYNNYGVKNIQVNNPSGFKPHYISQNYIMMVVNNDTSKKIEDIDIIKRLFPMDHDFQHRVQIIMGKFKTDVTDLISCVQTIENIESSLSRIPHVGSLVIMNEVSKNIFISMKPKDELRNVIKYPAHEFNEHVRTLESVKKMLEKNPFSKLETSTVDVLLVELRKLYAISEIEECVNNLIENSISSYDQELKEENKEDQTKSQTQNTLLELIRKYVITRRKFSSILSKISQYSFSETSKNVKSMGHQLYIENKFSLSQNKILETFNEFLKKPIRTYDEITPDLLFKDCYKQRPKVDSYDKFIDKVCASLNDENRITYKITTRDGKDFDSLSAGWKTSVLLDLVFGYTDDIAPIIIDQPEDNLATNYINSGLVRAIKQVKSTKQIILVSHNATIPMMADAQTIVYCKNNNGKITIKSSPLEGEIEGKPVLDLIATITDGGKPSIKKRVKKYNLKRYK